MTDSDDYARGYREAIEDVRADLLAQIASYDEMRVRVDAPKEMRDAIVHCRNLSGAIHLSLRDVDRFRRLHRERRARLREMH